MAVHPAVGTEVLKGTKVKIEVTGNWLTGIALPDVVKTW
jgi:hypothetical protein